MTRIDDQGSVAAHIARFAEYIDSLDDHARPHIDDFDLMDIHRLARFIVVVDVLDRPPRLRCRFVGTSVVAMYGSDATGRDVENLFGDGDDARELIRHYWEVARAGEPQFFASHVMRPDEPDDPYIYERYLVPLRNEVGQVGQIATMIHRRTSSGRPIPLNYSALGWHGG